ncbi:MAG: hypothetical protein U0176_22670 [Bacteroidia bacterium]
MFKIVLNAMWSKDYLTPLAKVVSETMPCSLDEATVMVRDLSDGRRMSLIAHTPSQAELLACDLLQFGCYIEVEQVGPLTDEIMIHDLQNWFADGQEAFSVLYDAQGHVQRIVEEQGYGVLRLESQPVADWVGEELIRLGARKLGASEAPALRKRLEKAIKENEVRRQRIRSERAFEKNRRMEAGESLDGLDSEEE